MYIDAYMKNQSLLCEEILITIEDHDREAKTVLFDFLDSDHLERFMKNLSFSIYNINDASMILFTNFDCSMRLRRGVYYRVSQSLYELITEAHIEQDSSIILFSVDASGRDIRDLVARSRVSAEYIYEISLRMNDNRIEEDVFFPTSGSKAKKVLSVKCVGQGSWNEFIFDGEVNLIYDIGTSWLERKTEVQKLIYSREQEYQKSKPVVVISHWDVDHYHLLKVASDDTIRAIKAIIFRSFVPSQTSKNIIARFRRLNPSALFPVQEESPQFGKSTSDLLKKIYGNGLGYYLFNGSKNKDRNKAGILVVFRTSRQVIVLAADFDYCQIDRDVLPEFRFPHDHYLIVPHHGGKAGKFVYDPVYSNLKVAIISVGKNSYNHPLFEIKEELRKKFKQLKDFKTKKFPYEYRSLVDVLWASKSFG